MGSLEEKLCEDCMSQAKLEASLARAERKLNTMSSFMFKHQKIVDGINKIILLDKAVPSVLVGDYHELVVSLDLFRRGYFVYRSLSRCSPSDLVILKRGESPLQVEVTTGIRKKGCRSIPSKSSKHQFDILAVVYHDGIIQYIPPFKEDEA
jgi:hypothetical protein